MFLEKLSLKVIRIVCAAWKPSLKVILIVHVFLEIVFLLIDWKEALNGEGASLRSVMRSFCRERQQIKEVSKVTTGYFRSFKRLFDGRFIHIIMKNYIYKLSISGSPPSHQLKRIKLNECFVTYILRPSSHSLWLLSEVDNNNTNNNNTNNTTTTTTAITA